MRPLRVSVVERVRKLVWNVAIIDRENVFVAQVASIGDLVIPDVLEFVCVFLVQTGQIRMTGIS